MPLKGWPPKDTGAARERTAAAAMTNRLLRLRRMAKELRDHGWTVEEPKDGPPVRPEVPRGGL